MESFARKPLPRAPGLPVLGSALTLLRDPLAALRRAHEARGPVFAVRAARRRFVVLAGREANRFAGGEGRDAFASTPFWGQLTEVRGCPHALIAVDGPEHSVQRRLYGDTLSRRVVDAHGEGCVDLVRRTARAAPPGARLEVRAFTRLLVSRLVHHTLARGARPVDEATAESLTEVFRWETNTLLLGKWPRLALRAPAYRRHLARTERFLDRLVDEDRRAGDDGLDGWFARIRRGAALHPELFTPGDVRLAYLFPFVAGVDTVGSTLGFVLYELARRPELYARARAEVRGAWPGDEVPDSATLKALPTLFGLVIECLRLYPAAFAIYRRTTRAFAFEGHEVPAGVDAVLFTSATHFDPAFFPDPDRLDPTRHAPPEPAYRQKHVFMPYGAGPHVCLGAGMGEALLLLATATLLRDEPFQMPDRPPTHGRIYDPSLTIAPTFTLRRRGDSTR